jgi:phenylpropionate dioxygenase-like ring-hydroxylating dioxygenase large terminal subunit
MLGKTELRNACDWENGLISPAIHFDEDVYREEQQQVFGRSWLVVGHEDMVRKPGDYVTNYMGEVPVIVTRGEDNKVHVLVNRCAHRGVEVCLFDRGNARSFTCSYHGWTYNLSGKLVGVPLERELWQDNLKKEAWGLEKVPSVATFHGLICASFDPKAPALEDWLGEDVCWWLKHFVLAAPLGGLEALPGWHRYRSPGNWKLISENFIGDDYHVFAATHVAWLKIMYDLRDRANEIPMISFPGAAQLEAYEGSGGYHRGCPFGMGIVVLSDVVYQRDLDEASRLGPEAVEWVQERRRVLHEALKERENKPYGFMNGLLFPNLGLMGFISPLLGRHFLLFHPRGPREHETWQWTMVEKNAPKSVKDLAVQRVHQGQHMAGLIAPDDVENFERLVEATGPRRNWDRPFYYGMQKGHEEDGPRGLPGNLGPNPSETNQRQFYKFWLGLMDREMSPAVGG